MQMPGLDRNSNNDYYFFLFADRCDCVAGIFCSETRASKALDPSSRTLAFLSGVQLLNSR